MEVESTPTENFENTVNPGAYNPPTDSNAGSSGEVKTPLSAKGQEMTISQASVSASATGESYASSSSAGAAGGGVVTSGTPSGTGPSGTFDINQLGNKDEATVDTDSRNEGRGEVQAFLDIAALENPGEASNVTHNSDYNDYAGGGGG